jgi:hypothetical protein
MTSSVEEVDSPKDPMTHLVGFVLEDGMVNDDWLLELLKRLRPGILNCLLNFAWNFQTNTKIVSERKKISINIGKRNYNFVSSRIK